MTPGCWQIGWLGGRCPGRPIRGGIRAGRSGSFGGANYLPEIRLRSGRDSLSRPPIGPSSGPRAPPRLIRRDPAPPNLRSPM
eukprot:scaffold21_cov368-Prasinococcus_capsulatus_cf.AAC.1